MLYLCLYEPLWQTQTVAALGILFPLLVRNHLFAALAGFAAILTLRLLQIALLAGIIIGLTWLALLRDAATFCGVTPFLLFIIPGVLYGFHRGASTLAISAATRRVF
jgi:hypothetical protein